MTVFFTSDTHFGHSNIIEYSNRPFKNIEEHDEGLIEKWNKSVGRGDLVYHLGDFALSAPKHAKNILRRLNGQIHFIYGNHDKRLKKDKEFLGMFAWHGDYKEVTAPPSKRKLILFHFPIESWNKRHYGAYHLHGHCHGSLPSAEYQCRVDVGVDVWNYAPVPYEEIKKHMEKKIFQPIDHHGQGHQR